MQVRSWVQMKIIAVGGGDMGAGETFSIDEELVRQSGKQAPNALFIPTASDDSDEYIDQFAGVYGDRLGCRVDVLRLVTVHVDETVIASKILDADLIYVGGGNTKAMLSRWRELGVDKHLKTHLDRGKPVGGLSAGAICWFRIANSDWPQYEGIPGVNTAALEGLGFVDLAICPHTRDEGFRLAEFRQMMKSIAGSGIGLDDGCALQIDGDQYRILSSQANSFAHHIGWEGVVLKERALEAHRSFRPLAELMRLP